MFVEEIVNRGLIYLKKCVVVEVFITSCERGGIYHHEKKKVLYHSEREKFPLMSNLWIDITRNDMFYFYPRMS